MTVKTNRCARLFVSSEEMSDAEAEMSSRSTGGRVLGPAEVHVPSAGWRQQTFRHLNVQQETEVTASETEDGDGGGDPQKPQLCRMGNLNCLHPTEGSLFYSVVILDTRF